MNRLSVLVVVLVFGNGHAMATTDVLVTAPAGGSPNEAWPRTMSLGTVAAVVYQPQVKAWSGDKLDFRVAVALTPPGSDQEILGAVSVSTRTRVDRVSRTVTLDQFRLERVLFPALPDRGAAYARALRRLLSALKTIARDRLETSMAAAGAVKPGGVVVANDPPQVITTEMSARHACSSSRSGCRPASSRVAACALAQIAVSGWFTSCASEDASWPMPATRSRWAS